MAESRIQVFSETAYWKGSWLEAVGLNKSFDRLAISSPTQHSARTDRTPFKAGLLASSALPRPFTLPSVRQKPLIFENAMAQRCQHDKSQSLLFPQRASTSVGPPLRPIGAWHFLAVSPSIFPILPCRIKASPAP